jgi:hypothetical protein
MAKRWLRRPRRRHPRGPYKTREQIAEALAERRANREAREKGLPLPFPNIWDELDPTKVSRDASPEEITARYREFCKICPPPRKRRYIV